MAVNEGGAAFLVLLNLSAAFDRIDYSILLARLQSWFGIAGVALDWLASYIPELSHTATPHQGSAVSRGAAAAGCTAGIRAGSTSVQPLHGPHASR